MLADQTPVVVVDITAVSESGGNTLRATQGPADPGPRTSNCRVALNVPVIEKATAPSSLPVSTETHLAKTEQSAPPAVMFCAFAQETNKKKSQSHKSLFT